MKHHSDSHRKSTIQASYSYESAAGIQTPFHINTHLAQPVQPISSQPMPLIPVESLNITDDFVDLKELPFHIPTQRFRHIESSTTPRYIGNRLMRECAVCLLLKPESEYRAPLSKDCQHSHRTVCYDCVYHNIVMLLGSRMSDPITCPELICPARLSTEDVRQILTYHDNMALLNKYDTHLTNTLLEKMPEFIWCAYGCGSGQLHPSFAPKVDCVVCNQSTCFFHHVPWHEGLTCEEYDIFGSSDDAVTLKYLKTFAKECPKCKVNIEKNNGCDHMTCTRCWTQFCWNCLAKFGSADSLYTCPHKRTCIYYQRASIHPERPFHEFNYRPSIRHRLRSALCTII